MNRTLACALLLTTSLLTGCELIVRFDPALLDGSGDARRDASTGDTVVDAGNDARDSVDAPDVPDVATDVGFDVADLGIDASDASDAIEPADVSDTALDSADATDATDATDASDVADASDGGCAAPGVTDGSTCDDGNPCTQTDTCQSGVCVGANPVVCVAIDQCHTAGTCDSSTGMCPNPARANGAACNDGDACTQTDTCQSGTCTGSNPVVCSPSDQCHAAGTCDSATGTCSNPVRADGAACNDGNGCTQTDNCQLGVCTGVDPVICTASDQCHTAGTCDSATGTCSNPARANGSACSDGNACTQTDTCQSGTCAGTNPVVCTASDQCHTAGTCDSATGTCSNPSRADGSACSDGNACTQTDTCQSGTCAGTNPIVCTASDQCHTAGTCNPGTGACSNPVAADGITCDDGNACTFTDVCSAGVCSGSTCTSGLCGTTLSAFTGTNTLNWNFNGSAGYDSTSNTAVLVDGGVLNAAGTLFYRDPLTVDTFDVTFDFRITNTGAGRADGLMFTLQTNGSTAVGAIGAGFGALGLTGYGVEFDVFDNGACEPGNGNHAGVDLLSACSTNSIVPTPVATSPDLFDGALPGGGIGDIGDGAWRTAVMHFAGGMMSVTIRGIPVTNLQNVTLPGFTSASPYYFGFSAGTGGLASRHEIRNVQITFPSSRCL